jgi:hypothetical protein
MSLALGAAEGSEPTGEVAGDSFFLSTGDAGGVLGTGGDLALSSTCCSAPLRALVALATSA